MSIASLTTTQVNAIEQSATGDVDPCVTMLCAYWNDEYARKGCTFGRPHGGTGVERAVCRYSDQRPECPGRGRTGHVPTLCPHTNTGAAQPWPRESHGQPRGWTATRWPRYGRGCAATIHTSFWVWPQDGRVYTATLHTVDTTPHPYPLCALTQCHGTALENVLAEHHPCALPYPLPTLSHLRGTALEYFSVSAATPASCHTPPPPRHPPSLSAKGQSWKIFNACHQPCPCQYPPLPSLSASAEPWIHFQHMPTIQTPAIALFCPQLRFHTVPAPQPCPPPPPIPYTLA